MDPDQTIPMAPLTEPAPPPSDMSSANDEFIPVDSRDERFLRWADSMLRGGFDGAPDDFNGFASEALDEDE